MLTRRYPRYTGEYFTYSYALVFTNRFWTLIMSGLLMIYLKPRRSESTVIYEYSFPAISNMLSSWCQYEALRYVSFPATTLFKSFKLGPVMAMGKILGNKSCKYTYEICIFVWITMEDTSNIPLHNDDGTADPQYDYIVALMIGIGIAMFMASTDELSFGYDYLGEKASAKWTGVMLLFLFLFFDSFTSQFQSRMFQRHRDLSVVGGGGQGAVQHVADSVALARSTSSSGSSSNCADSRSALSLETKASTTTRPVQSPFSSSSSKQLMVW